MLIDDNTARPSARLDGGESIEVEPQELAPLRAVPENIPLETLYEDDDCVVVYKPSGMAVHAGAGAAGASGTLVNALLHRYHGKLSSIGGELRPGIVHRPTASPAAPSWPPKPTAAIRRWPSSSSAAPSGRPTWPSCTAKCWTPSSIRVPAKAV